MNIGHRKNTKDSISKRLEMQMGNRQPSSKFILDVLKISKMNTSAVHRLNVGWRLIDIINKPA
jgi:hypothetical protein